MMCWNAMSFCIQDAGLSGLQTLWSSHLYLWSIKQKWDELKYKYHISKDFMILIYVTKKIKRLNVLSVFFTKWT